MRLLSSVRAIDCLDLSDRDAMFRLMDETYANMQRDRFDADLDAKQWVIEVRCPVGHHLVGFSTQVLLDAQIRGRSVQALYSGDTVIDRNHWGDPALAHAWGNFALELADRDRVGELYWFLTSKGFRTYRYLPLFFCTYYPRPETPAPSWEQSVIDAFGQRVGHDSYDPHRQIVFASPGKDSVRREIAEPGMRLNTDQHVRFFVERNPGFRRGDELCCLAPLSRENFTRVAYRMIHASPQPLNAV